MLRHIEYETDIEDFKDACQQLTNCIINIETELPEFSKEKERELKKNTQQLKAKEMQQKAMMISFLTTLDDEQASQIPLLYKNWDEYEDTYLFKKDDRVEYKEKLWKCLQDHDKQVNREPDIAVSLWVIAYTEEYPEWKQPTGAHDAYNTGDKCTYQGKKYISKINGNTTIPGSDNRYWEEVV